MLTKEHRDHRERDEDLSKPLTTIKYFSSPINMDKRMSLLLSVSFVFFSEHSERVV